MLWSVGSDITVARPLHETSLRKFEMEHEHATGTVAAANATDECWKPSTALQLHDMNDQQYDPQTSMGFA
jgi:predicted cobalt transporter CbtA